MALNGILKPTKYYAGSKKKEKRVNTRVGAGSHIAPARSPAKITQGPEEDDTPYTLMPATPIGFHDYKSWWEFTSYGFRNIIPEENAHGLYFTQPIPWNPMSALRYFKERLNDLAGREKKALARYVYGYAFPINNYLRDPRNFDISIWDTARNDWAISTELIDSTTRELRKMLKKSPLLPKNLILYRWEILVDRAPHKNGEVFLKKDFTSTSVRSGSVMDLKNNKLKDAREKNPGKNVRVAYYRIILRNHKTRGIYIDKAQHEVLLPPDLTFRVVRTEEVRGKLFQTLEII
ncbi:ADP-ribosyltransferase [Elusimicrobiota bacterium]